MIIDRVMGRCREGPELLGYSFEWTGIAGMTRAASSSPTDRTYDLEDAVPRDTDPQPWDVESSRYLSRKPWMTLRQDRVRLPNGSVIDDYHVLEYPDWVNVLAVTEAGLIVLVRQYRHGIRAVHYELPGGVCDPDDAGPEQTARRELLEETGYVDGVWSPLSILSANPSTHANRTHTFLATGVRRVQEPTPEATEDIRVHLASTEEVRRILEAGGVMQALHASPLWQLLASRRA